MAFLATSIFGDAIKITVKASVFTLLQPTPLGVPSHSTSGSTGGVPICVSAVASGSVKSAGRMIVALIVGLVPSAANTFTTIVKVIVASLGKLTVASRTPPVIVSVVTAPPKVEDQVEDCTAKFAPEAKSESLNFAPVTPFGPAIFFTTTV
ncbi:hypothetical protein FLACOL7796_03959 [Flavobacterium collinsii]|uniref:Uncharacterized protein n=1 Tax=Flavobacterium collinsii TaxID=1114861 RepID=A0ABM8KNF3_9FLAO|nr:hypothetical protein FLACOL7796_03959 [Flavobacterium collinsii]